MSYQENFWVLFSKKLSNEATTSELKELENLIKDHPEWQYAIQNLEDLWKHQPAKDNSDEDDAYMLHIHRMKELGVPFGEMTDSVMPAKSKKRRILWYSAAVAAMLIAGFFLIGSFYAKNKNSQTPIAREVNEISTRPGSKSKVELPDGSIVWLNAGSKLTYNKDFGKEKREVTLAGEGFFDVTKNNEMPFIISTASINIKVLGTTFNVKAYNEDKQTETSLLHGSIEVTIKNRPNDKIILSPSEKLVVENSITTLGLNDIKKSKENITRTTIKDINTLVSINKLKYNPEDSTVAESQWINNKLIFRDEAFSDLAIQMERWFNVSIEIKNEKVAKERLNGTLESVSITQVLEALQVSTPFRYEKAGNKVIIY